MHLQILLVSKSFTYLVKGVVYVESRDPIVFKVDVKVT